MFGRQERLAILFLLGIAAAVIASHLILDQLGKRPFAAPYSEASREGDLVFLTGTVDQVSVTKTGGHLLIQINSTTVFVPGTIASGLTVTKGTNLSVIGTVQGYRGKKEVTVQSGSDISINP